MSTYRYIIMIISVTFLTLFNTYAQTPVWDNALGSPVVGSYFVSYSAGELRIPHEVPYSPDTDWSIVADNLDMAFRGSGQTWIRVLNIEETGTQQIEIVISKSENASSSSRNAFLGTEETHIEILQAALSSPVTPPSPDSGDEEDDYPESDPNPEAPRIPDMPKPSDGLSPQRTKNWIIKETISGTSSHKEVTYYDGLGRVMQKVNVGGGRDCLQDIISLYSMDVFGNENKLFLPYLRDTSNGACDTLGLDAQYSYYSKLYGNLEGVYAYREQMFENYPGGRLLKSYLPGNELINHPSQIDYMTNGPKDVEITDVNAVNGNVSISNYYPAGTLHGEQIQDGDLRIHTTWKDCDGRLVCTDTGTGEDRCRTLYGYDFKGNLSWVISPEGYEQLSGSTNVISINCEIANKYCWRYRYDSRGNMTAKYSPGAGLQLTLYDAAGRLIMMQDANMREKRIWVGYTYDNAGRLLIEKEVIDSTATDWSLTLPELDVESLTRILNDGNGKILREYFYDRQPDIFPSDMSFISVSDVVELGDLNLDYRGHLTYEKLSTTQGTPYADRVYYYDMSGNIVQTIEKRPSGVLRTSFKYNLQKQIIRYHCVYLDQSSNLTDTYTSAYKYDHDGRLIEEETALNGHVAKVEYQYDKLGRLIGKSYPGDSINEYVPIESFSYNMQGWEDEHCVYVSDSVNIYTSKLHYYDNISNVSPSFTGNITSWDWTSDSNTNRTYKYSYDGTNRLTDAKEYENGILVNNYSEYDIRYDHNGNILSMIRKNESEPQILNFSYNGNRRAGNDFDYDANGNLTTDNLAGVTAEYDIFNHPRIIFGNGDYSTEYCYLVDGTKIYSMMEETLSGYYYAGPFIYSKRDDSYELRCAVYGGGRIFKDSNDNYSTIIYFKDHLGSTRLKVKGEDEIVGRYDYLPYGELVSNSMTVNYENDWLFGGKELETGNDISWYDSEARYLTTHGVFTSQDPLAEEYFSLSPYNYCASNPINIVDPSGKSWFYNKSTGEFVTHINNKDDYIYLITPDDIIKARSKSNYKRYAKFENYFGQYLLEGDYDKDVVKNVFADLIGRANKTSEFSNEDIVTIRNIIISYDKTKHSYATASPKSVSITVYALNGNYFRGYDSMLIFAHEIYHLIDTSKNSSNRELRADEFARSHWAYPKASEVIKNILKNHTNENH